MRAFRRRLGIAAFVLAIAVLYVLVLTRGRFLR